MKKISLVTVLLLFTSVAGFAQNTEVDIRVKGIKHTNADSVFLSQFDAYPGTDSLEYIIFGTPMDFFSTNSNLDRLLTTLSKRDDVTAITITRSLLDIMPDINSYVEENGVNIQKVVAKLKHIDIVSSKSDAAKKIMRTLNNDISRRATKIGVLMRIKNEDNNIVFYGETNNDEIKSLILFSDSKSDKENSVLIRLVGVFNQDDLKQIIKMKIKNKEH
jgi:hypothetical protein